MAVTHTPDTVKAQMQADIAASNAKTGAADTTLHDAVSRLIDGYGTGSGGITPSGTKEITSNGTHDVTNYAYANVSVPVPEQMTEVRTITFSSDIVGSGQLTTIYSADEFVKRNYNKDGFSITMYPVTNFAATANDVLFIYHANKNIGSSGATRTGVVLKATSATATGVGNCTAKISGTGYNLHFRATSDGKLSIYTAANYTIKAGNYTLIMTCID